jgi:flagellin-like hook-associated protein FlgL
MSVMSDIVLSASVRQNLLSLQSTAHLMSLTQNRLATGKKVNTALDNPSNFFTSQSLSNRARDLNGLLDSIGQAQKTLEAADQGITSLTKLVESAKSIAKQARQAPQPSAVTYGTITVGATADAETLADHDGGTITVTDSTLYSFTININGTGARTVNYTSGVGATYAQIRDGLIADFATEVAAAGFTAGTDIELVQGAGGDDIRVRALNADIDFVIGAGAGNSGLTANTYNSTSLLDLIVAGGGTAGVSTLTVAVNGGANQVITFGTGGGQISTLAELNTALSGLTGVTASATGTGNRTLSFQVASSATQNSLTLTGSTGVDSTLNITNGTTNGVASVSTPDPARASLQADYNSILLQIDALAKDASYNGINLLYGDDLKVIFNEVGSSSMTVAGVTYDSTGLGLIAVTGTYFQVDANVDTTLTALSTALATLRNQASKFGSTLTTVQARQDFTKNLIGILETGADNLVLADTNEEGANMLALQTRQQLSTTALSLSAQADQAVLRLFG